MKIPDRDGRPVVTTEMKVDCMGEFKITVQTVCLVCMGEGCDSCDGSGGCEQDFDIPWTTMKDIYKRMALVASHCVSSKEMCGNKPKTEGVII